MGSPMVMGGGGVGQGVGMRVRGVQFFFQSITLLSLVGLT